MHCCSGAAERSNDCRSCIRMSKDMWWGKLVGGTLGFVVGHGFVGAALGLFVGHLFDRGLTREMALDDEDSAEEQSRIQLEFFTTTFSVMGHLAKADGRVSEDEIAAARGVMRRMRLTPE